MSAKLAMFAKSLEAAGHSSVAVAGFVTRCPFSMFAEDVELLPKGSFKGLLAKHRANPPVLLRMLEALWREMDVGGKERHLNARQAAWPDADFITGNPPFIGAGPMRLTLGDGYVEALRGAWPEVPESTDLVMFW